MVVLGLILLVLATIVALGVALDNTGPADASAFGVSLDGVSVGGLFLLGMAVGALALLGLAMMLSGARRKRTKRVAAQREVSDVRGERESLAEENARLQAELERSSYASSAPVPDSGVRDDSPRGPGQHDVRHEGHGSDDVYGDDRARRDASSTSADDRGRRRG